MAKKTGLGKGLGALISEANIEAGNNDNITEIAISQIHPNAFQPRKNFNEDELKELVNSIKQHGILQPILLRRDKEGYEIVAGERRYQASKKAKLSTIPALVKDINDEDVFCLALIENLQRSNLNPIEEAQGYKRLIDDKKLTHDELAKLLSKSRSTITNALRLLELPDYIQDLMAQDLLSSGHARAILSVKDATAQKTLTQRIVDEKLSVRKAEQLAAMLNAQKSASQARTPLPETYKYAAKVLRKKLGTRVRVKNTRGKNKIEIEFEDEAQLEHILSSIKGE